MYSKLCNFDFFTQETQQTIDRLQGDLKSTGSSLKTSPSFRQLHFQRLLLRQGRFAELQAKDENIRSTLTNIHSMLTPHMEVL